MDLLLIAMAVLLGLILLTVIGRDGIMWTVIVVGSLTVGILMLLVVYLAAITSPAVAWADISHNGLILSIAMAVLLGLVLLTVIGVMLGAARQGAARLGQEWHGRIGMAGLGMAGPGRA